MLQKYLQALQRLSRHANCYIGSMDPTPKAAMVIQVNQVGMTLAGRCVQAASDEADIVTAKSCCKQLQVSVSHQAETASTVAMPMCLSAPMMPSVNRSCGC